MVKLSYLHDHRFRRIVPPELQDRRTPMQRFQAAWPWWAVTAGLITFWWWAL